MKNQTCRGFTLIEMALVLMIVGLLLGGGLTVLTAQLEQRRVTDTQRMLEEAREALIGFAVTNGRLPCPATGSLASGAPGAGIANLETAVGCTGGQTGVLPWATLGVSQSDAWGWRFTYRVPAQFSRTVDATRALTLANFPGCAAGTLPAATPPRAAFALCSAGDVNVCPSSVGCPAASVATAVPAVVLSHGRAGAGAFNEGGTLIAASANPDEAANSDGNTDFVARTPTETFDDVVTWVAPGILFNRMVQAGRLP